MTIGEITDLSRAELRHLMHRGYSLNHSDIAGYTYEGVSLGLPGWLARMTWTKFQKAFYRDPETEGLRGWNIKTVDDGLHEPWTDVEQDGVPRTFGHFDVVDLESAPSVIGEGRGLLLDYGRKGRGGNGLLNPLRDPVVSLTPGGADLLLGWSYLSILGCALGTPSYFLLRRGRPVDYVPPTPG